MPRLGVEQLENRDALSVLLPGYSPETQDFLASRGFTHPSALGADLTGDGNPELIVYGDTGDGPRMLVFDGAVRTLPSPALNPNLPGLPPLLYDGFVPVFDPATWRSGLAVTAVGQNYMAGDPNYESARLVVAAPDGSGGGPVASVFSLGPQGFHVENRFLLDDPDFRGGVNLNALDADGDGRAELFVTAGSGGAPRLEVFDLSGPVAVSIHSVFIGPVDDRSGDWRVVDIVGVPPDPRVLILDHGGVPVIGVDYDTGLPVEV